MSEPVLRQRRIRWKAPAIIVALAVVVIIALHRRDWVESYIAAYATAFVIFLAVLLLLGWFVLFSGASGRARVVGVGSFVALVGMALVVGYLTTRVEGTYSGVGVPRFVWRWSKPPETVSSIQTFDGKPVDLSVTTPLDSPEFLGPGRRNAIEGIGLARTWSDAQPRRLWRQPIGLGWSSFAVVGPWAVTQEQRGTDELVACYEVETGHLRWAHVHPHTRFSEWQGGDGPRATPTIFGGRVYAMGATGVLDCLGGASGNPIWSRDVLHDTGSNNLDFGKSCSPLIVDERVVVTAGRGGPSLVAYRQDNGDVVWKGGNETPGYASPVLATLAGVRQIVTVNSRSVTGHDATDGRVLWRFDWPGYLPKTVNPVPLDGDRVLIAAGYGLGTTLLKITPSSGGAMSVSELWTSRRLKPKFANVALRGNCVYGLDDGVLVGLDVSTGKRLWRGDEYGFGEVLRVDDLLLVQAEDGQVALVEATPQAFHELARFSALDGKTWTNPALAGHRLLVRNDHEAACYELP